jgi:hypothetical protein
VPAPPTAERPGSPEGLVRVLRAEGIRDRRVLAAFRAVPRARVGPRRACSSNSRWCCWTSSAKLVGSTWIGSAWTPSACRRSKGDLTGANPVDRGKAGSKLHLAGDAVDYRLP